MPADKNIAIVQSLSPPAKECDLHGDLKTIGIDLGTTNCCVASLKHGKPEIIINNQGKRTTPSFISFHKDQILFGADAKKRLDTQPENTIYDIKRIIGRNHLDEVVEKAKLNYKYIIDNKEKINIQVKSKNGEDYYSPEEISALLLMELKRHAEAYLDEEVDRVVIAVPAHFTDSQRQATIDAGRLAGFEKVKLLNEPTAAAIAYALDKKTNKLHTSLIFDFGGGTFDVSIITFQNNKIEVKSMDGNSSLGGVDIDQIICNYFVEEIKKELNFDITSNNRKYFRLLEKCKNAKEALAFVCEDLNDLEYIKGEESFSVNLTRAKLNSLNNEIFKEAIRVVENCLKLGRMKKEDIDDVVLVGGSTRIIKIQNLLTEYFGKTPKSTISPDEAVAEGAAIEAARWKDDKSVRNIIFFDVTPWSLGVKTIEGIMNVIIHKNTNIPTENTKTYVTTMDNQTSLDIDIFCGENFYTKDNYHLGNLEISDIPPAPKGTYNIDVTFSVGEDSMLAVIVKSSGIEEKIKILLSKGRLSDEEIVLKQQKLKSIFK